MKIWKYVLVLAEVQTVTLPVGFKFLSVQMQGGNITFWALVDPMAEYREVAFVIQGTGETIPENYNILELTYLGTVQDDVYVWHVFKKGK